MKKILFSLLVVAAVFPGCSSNPAGMALQKEWSYAMAGRDESPSVYSQKDFQPIAKLSGLERFLPDREGYLWLKTEFILPETLRHESVALWLGRVSMSDEVFVNGVRIGNTGAFPPKFFSRWNTNRLYSIPEHIVEPERENVLLIKVYIQGRGSVSGVPTIVSFDKGTIFHGKREAADSGIYMLLAVFLWTLSLWQIVLWCIRPDEKENLFLAASAFFAGVCLCEFFIAAIPGFAASPPSYLVFQKAMFIGLCALGWVTPLFFRSYSGKKAHAIVHIILAVSMIIPASVILIPQELRTFAAVRFLLVPFFAVPAVNLLVTGIISATRNRTWDSLIFCATVPFWLSLLADGVVHLVYAFDTAVYAAPFGFAVMIAVSAAVKAARFASRVHYAEAEMEKLSVIAAEKSGLLDARNRELADARRSGTEAHLMAAHIQKSLFIDRIPSSIGWDVAFLFKPMSGISADLYDFYSDGQVLSGAALFDVSGHGVGAGLITILAQSVVSEAFNSGREKKLGEVLEQVNNDLIREIGHVDNYLTGMLLRFTGSRVEYVNAAHTELLYKRSQTGSVGIVNLEHDDIKGRFLGVEGMSEKYQSIQFDTEKNDIILLYSDCLTGSTNSGGEAYGLERVKRSLGNAPSGSAQEIRDCMVTDFLEFVSPSDATAGAVREFILGTGKGVALKDDITMIVLRRTL